MRTVATRRLVVAHAGRRGAAYDAALSALLPDGGQSFINGAWRGADATFAVRDPATGDVVLECADCGAADTLDAIAAAEAAFPAWAATPARARADALRAWHTRIVDAADDLAVLATAECGKPLAEAKGEAAYAASFVEWFAEEAPRVAGEVKANVASDRRLLTIRTPVGVAAAVTPWNFPLAMITRKVAPAIAAGCPVVVKPSEETPLTALALARLADGLFPPGVVNVVAASRESTRGVGETLCDHKAVRALSFTGSTAVGKWLYARCADTVKKLGLELGGNAPFLVLEGADVDVAVAAAAASKFRNAGQTCVCADRFLVHESVKDAFVEKIATVATALRPGHGLDEGTTLGPLVSAAAVEKVDARVTAAVAAGATVVAGGDLAATRESLAPELRGGHFYPATVVVDVPESCDLWADESFGPVVAISTFTDVADAVARANAGDAGLAAYVCGPLADAWAAAERLDYGIVGVNEAAVSHATMPFGGVKESGLGREGGAHGMDEYLEDKYLCLGGLKMS